MRVGPPKGVGGWWRTRRGGIASSMRESFGGARARALSRFGPSNAGGAVVVGRECGTAHQARAHARTSARHTALPRVAVTRRQGTAPTARNGRPLLSPGRRGGGAPPCSHACSPGWRRRPRSSSLLHAPHAPPFLPFHSARSTPCPPGRPRRGVVALVEGAGNGRRRRGGRGSPSLLFAPFATHTHGDARRVTASHPARHPHAVPGVGVELLAPYLDRAGIGRPRPAGAQRRLRRGRASLCSPAISRALSLLFFCSLSLSHSPPLLSLTATGRSGYWSA